MSLTNLNPNQSHLLSSFYQHLKTPSKKYNDQTPRYRSRSNSSRYRQFSRESRSKSRIPAQTLVQKITITTPLINIVHFMILTEFAMINIIEDLLQKHNILLAQTFFQHPLVAHQTLTLVLTKAPLVIITPLPDALNNHIVLLLNQVLIAIEINLTVIQYSTQTTNTKPQFPRSTTPSIYSPSSFHRTSV